MRVVARTVVIACLVALALPGAASAHGGTGSIAMGYRLELGDQPGLVGIDLRLTGGYRALEARVDPGIRFVVRGSLNERFIRIDDRGVWVNGDSPTAEADRLVPPNTMGWVKVSDGRALTWHDHRLAPPGLPAPALGNLDRYFEIPVWVDGRRAVIVGRFVDAPGPALWPWLGGALVFGAATWAVSRRVPWRSRLTIGLGALGGAAALLAITTFSVRAAPNGGVAWLQLVGGIVIAVVLAGLLVGLRGRRRVNTAGAIGAVAAAVGLSSLSIFWNGVVISALPASAARLACAAALLCGVAAALLTFLPELDEPVRRAR
jgi:hypothetical protein